jgi:DNA-binding response OmpR family regulator
VAGEAMSTHERAVLGLLLEHHPGLLSLDEVVRYVAPEPADFAERDAVEVAIRTLAQSGLVYRLERFVFASAAAAHMERLGSG